MKKVAVILCGAGFRDGSEIRESVGVLWALSQLSASYGMYAPDRAQKEVVDCLTGKTVEGETRNMLVESARIARGRIQPLTELQVAAWDAIIIPGGYGAAKNLCTFAYEGARGTVLPGLDTLLVEAHKRRKPIGAVCIAPAVVGLALKDRALEMTLGPKSEASQELEKLGHKHVVRKADEIHTDLKNKIVSTPAYMYDDAPLHTIFTGILKLCQEVSRMG